MSKKLFSNVDIDIFAKNIYDKKAIEKGITYIDAIDELKKLFIVKNKNDKLLRDIFVECGIDINIIGLKRIQSATGRLCSTF